MALKYVNQVYQQFKNNYELHQIKKASKFSLVEFKSQIKMIADDFNSNYEDKSKEALSEVLKFKSVLVESLERIREREKEISEISDKMDEIDDKQIQLMQISNQMRSQAQRQQYL